MGRPYAPRCCWRLWRYCSCAVIVSSSDGRDESGSGPRRRQGRGSVPAVRGDPCPRRRRSEFRAGITGLLGPNGAGKTTLLSVLATVNEPDGGRVSVFGLDPSDRGERVE